MRAGLARLAPLLLVGLVLPALAGPDEETSPREAWARTRVEAVERLRELAKWCASAKLFAARAEVYEAVLAFDPDDAVARKWLRYERDGDGPWRRRPGYTPPHDRSRSRDRYEERRDAWDAWFERAALDAVRTAEEASDVGLRSRVLAAATRVVPASRAVRTENGEILVHTGEASHWLLVESHLARKRRKLLQKIANDAVAAVPPPRPGTFVPADDAEVQHWRGVLQGERVRVLGTPDDDELRLQHTYCEACWPVYRAALDLDPPTWSSLERYARGMSVYVFADVAHGNAFLERQPAVPERYREFVKTLAALWIPSRAAILVKTPTRLARLEGGPKQILGGMSSALLEIQGEEGWASEGLDHYLVHLITGTRILSSVTDLKSRYGQPRPGLPDVKPRAIDQDDWLGRGLDLLRSTERPDFYLMVGKNVNDLTVNDVLYGYCIVAYLIEGRPKACAPFLRAVGEAKGVDLEPLVEKHLGFDIAAFEARVERWLDETTSGPR